MVCHLWAWAQHQRWGCKDLRKGCLVLIYQSRLAWPVCWQRSLKPWAQSEQTSCLGFKRVGSQALPSLPGLGQHGCGPRAVVPSWCRLLTAREDLQTGNGSRHGHPWGMHAGRCGLPVPSESGLHAGLGAQRCPRNCFCGNALCCFCAGWKRLNQKLGAGWWTQNKL